MAGRPRPTAPRTSTTMRGSVLPRVSYESRAPSVPYTARRARPKARRPTPREEMSVPSISNRTRRRSGWIGRVRATSVGAPPQAVDGGGQDIEHVVDLVGCRPASEAEAEGALDGPAVAPDGPQHVRWFAGQPSPGGAGRRGYPLDIQLEEQRIRLDPRDDQARVVREPPAGAGARDADARHALEGAEQEVIAQGRQPRRLGRSLRAQQVGGDAHTRDGRQVLHPRAMTSLLTPAEDLRGDADAGPHPEGAGARRSVHVVAGQAQEIDAPVVDEQRGSPDRADAVDVEQHAPAPRLARHISNRLDRSDLAARRDERDEARIRANRVSDGRGIDAPFHVDADVGHRMPAPLEVAAGVEDGHMLDGRGHEVTPGRLVRRSPHREIIGLGRARG